MSDVEVGGGPSGIRTQDGRIKVSGSSLKTAANRTETPRKHADLTPPSRYEGDNGDT